MTEELDKNSGYGDVLETHTLKDLKGIADLFGISYPNNITADKLRQQIRLHSAELHRKDKEAVDAGGAELNYDPTKVGEVKAEAFKLQRFKIINNNPNQSSRTGIFISAGNDVVGSITKTIPMNADAWHAEAIIVEHLKNHLKFHQFNPRQDSFGKQGNYLDHTHPMEVPSFTIIPLPPLTSAQLEALRRMQEERGTGRMDTKG